MCSQVIFTNSDSRQNSTFRQLHFELNLVGISLTKRLRGGVSTQTTRPWFCGHLNPPLPLIFLATPLLLSQFPDRSPNTRTNSIIKSPARHVYCCGPGGILTPPRSSSDQITASKRKQGRHISLTLAEVEAPGGNGTMRRLHHRAATAPQGGDGTTGRRRARHHSAATAPQGGDSRAATAAGWHKGRRPAGGTLPALTINTAGQR